MADNSKPHPQRLRTFAADLALERSKRGIVAAAPVEKSSSVVPPPQIAAAPKATKPIVREKEPLSPVVPQSPKKHDSPTLAELSHNKTAPNKIPAFHELQKTVTSIREDITAEPAKKPDQQKIKKPAHPSAPRPNIGYDATIITDTKSDRFQLLPSIIESVRSWFKKLAIDHKKKKAPKYTVPEADRRKGVIQRATSKTGTIFTADSETLKEQIRRRRQQEKLDDEAETFWTPFTETGFSLLEAPEEAAPTIQHVTVTYKKPAPTPTTPVATPQTVSFPAPVVTYEPSTMPSEETTPVENVVPETITEARWEISHDYPEDEQLVIPEASGAIPETTPTEETTSTRRLGAFSSFDTNTLTVIILIVIIGLVALTFIARIIITKIQEVPEKTASIEIPTDPVLSTAKLVGVPLTVETLEQLPKLVQAAVATSSMGLVEYAVVSAVGDEVSASYLFELLGFHTTPHLRQSITTARFATVNRAQPALILQFTDLDAVRGGLLAWEESMAADVLPLYTSTALPAGLSFLDETIFGYDARVIRHEGKTHLVYGIVGRNTVIIAPDTALFAQLVELGLAP